MAKTSGGVRVSALGLTKENNSVQLKNTNWKNGDRKTGIIGLNLGGKTKYIGIVKEPDVGWHKKEANTGKAVLAWMKKRGFVPR